jgi:hypothetical protein
MQTQVGLVNVITPGSHLPPCLLPPQAGKYNRLDLQQLMVQAIPWLDWRSHIKGEEVRALAEWLWWLAVQAQQEGVVGVHVATDQPVVTRVHTTGYKRRYPYSYFG